ncbi:MAG: hypothetical protein IT443_13440 [Phycisphaeraceae bacterium]|nr:hypothetical protein [Phycisphaeraceae bacterium]
MSYCHRRTTWSSIVIGGYLLLIVGCCGTASKGNVPRAFNRQALIAATGSIVTMTGRAEWNYLEGAVVCLEDGSRVMVVSRKQWPAGYEGKRVTVTGQLKYYRNIQTPDEVPAMMANEVFQLDEQHTK